MEGFFKPGSRAARNNNPGNLWDGSGRIWPHLPHDDKGFVIFPSLDAGWRALERQVELDAKRGLTLETFLHKYAPATENNTENYIRFVAGRVGIPRDVPLRDLFSSDGGGSSPGSPPLLSPSGWPSSWPGGASWEVGSEEATQAAVAIGLVALVWLIVA